MSEIKKIESFPILWRNKSTGKSTSAGVAFFNDEKGVYRLKVDIFASRDIYYLTPTAAQNDNIYFVLEKIIENRQGKLVKKAKISECVGKNTLILDIAPYDNYQLIVRLNPHE